MTPTPSLASIQTALSEIATEELGWTDGIPSGDLSSELDSVQRLSLIVAIEDRFEICFEPEDESSIHSLEELSQSILRLIEQPS